VDQKEALELLVKYELAFGGKVADVSKTFLRVKTKVFHCMDTALFEGTEEEMLPLLQIAHLYTQEVLNEKDPKVFENMADFILEKTGGKPLFISLGADILAGNHRLRRIIERTTGGKEHG
jgi:hypothetical protein